MVTKNLFFIDSRIVDYKKIVDKLPSNSNWVLLNSDLDGIKQISEAVKVYSKLDSIQIVSHGADATLYLGSSNLNNNNLQAHAAQLKTIGSRLTAGGDILLYGCDVASSTGGEAFIAELAKLTGADVAASADKTGSTSSANWVLEISTGDIKSTALNINGFNQTLGTFNGTDGNDSLKGEGEADIMDGKAGNDLIEGGANHDSIVGGSGNDTLNGGFGNDTLQGGDGNDVLSDEQGSNQLDGGAGSDALTARSLTGEQTLIGGAGYDVLQATGLKLSLSGGGEDDRLTATGAMSVGSLYGNAYVQQGQATLSGGLGNDILDATFLDIANLTGDDGDDTLSAGAAQATLDGGSGNDLLTVNFGNFSSQIGGQPGSRNVLIGGLGDDVLIAQGYAWGKASMLFDGGEGNDVLTVGEDVNYGFYADVTLQGGAGDDRLSATGVLNLHLTGGAGRDSFSMTPGQYATLLEGSVTFATRQPTEQNGWDYGLVTNQAEAVVITDFTAGSGGDVLDVKDLMLKKALGYDGGNPFASGYLQVTQSGADTLLSFDADGAAGSSTSMVTLAVLRNTIASSLSAANFNPGHSPDGSGVGGLVIAGSSGRDTLAGGFGDDTLSGNAGADSIDGAAGADLIRGGSGNDTLLGGYGDDTLMGDGGNDTLRDDIGSNVLNGGAGNDALSSASLTGQATLIGGAGKDTLEATGSRLVLDGGDGNDRLIARGAIGQNYPSEYVKDGEAELTGGDGVDQVEGRYFSRLVLTGDEGDDTLKVADSKSATVVGGAGDDTISGVFNDYFGGLSSFGPIGLAPGLRYVLDGGAGDDIVSIRGRSAQGLGKIDVSVAGGSGNDVLSVTDELVINSFSGVSAIDNATIDGGEGDDLLAGAGVLNLSYTGGAGQDLFKLSLAQFAASQRKAVIMSVESIVDGEKVIGYEVIDGQPVVITDFAVGAGGDRLDVDDLLINGAIGFDGVTPFGDGYLALEQYGANTMLKFDADGSASTKSSLVTVAIIHNVTPTSLTAANFLSGHSPDGAVPAGRSIVGTTKSDVLLGGNGNDTISGGAGGDTLDGLGGSDLLRGGSGDDTLEGGVGNDTLYGEAGDDYLTDEINGSHLFMDGGDGDDVIYGHSLGEVAFFGGAGSDHLDGSGVTKVVFFGGEDDDYLLARGFNAAGSEGVISGDDGDDVIQTSGFGSAILRGGEGNDRLSDTGNKQSTLEGGAGDDQLEVQYWYDSSGVDFLLDGGEGNDAFLVNGYRYHMHGKVTLELLGGDGNDIFSIDEVVYEGNNSAIALAVLNGGAGDDILSASSVLDLRLSGGTGRDTFVLTVGQYKATLKAPTKLVVSTTANGPTHYESAAAKPIAILDFAAGNGGDTMDVRDLLQNATSGYDGTNPFASGYLKLEQSGADTLMRFDADGTAGATKSLVTLAVLAGVNAGQITAPNFSPGFGTPNDDFLAGTPGADVLNGIEGNDTLSAGLGNDTMYGGVGNDSLDGGSGADSMDGGTGADVLNGGDGNDTVDAGTGDDQLFSGAGNDSYQGGEGNDILFFGSDNSTINIGSGSASGSTEGLDNFTGIEAVDAGAGNDTVTGSTASDYIFGGTGNDSIDGGSGNDELTGGAGSDTLNGGDGIDCAEYAISRSDLLINLLTGTASGSDIGQDTLVGIEVVCSGSGNDQIIAGNTGNELEGGEGNDTLVGGMGTDTLIGGEGVDEVSYSQLNSAVIVDLSVGTTTGSGSGSDKLESIEDVVGSQAADLITGSSADNELEGGLGNDTLSGGAGNDVLFAGTGNDTVYGGEGTDLIIGGDGAGDDRYDGGSGTDTVKYTSAISGIRVDLSKGTAGSLSTASVDAAGIGRDVLVSIENVIAGNFTDSITGSAANNRLEGLLGNDTLNGGTGADTMIGGDGSDTYYVDNLGDVVTETNATAAGGTDTVLSSIASYTLGANIETGRILTAGTASMAGNSLNNLIFAGAGNNVLDGGLGTDFLSYANGLVTGSTTGVRVDLSVSTAQLTGGSGSDTLLNFESLEGSILADMLTGNTSANFLLGGSGNDTLSGGAGNDTLMGGAGKDSLTGGTGSDLFDFNALSETGITSTTWDIITDFNRTEGDKIDLSTIDAKPLTTSNNSFSGTFISATGNFTEAGQLKFVISDGKGFLHGNTDTDVDAEFVIELIGVTSLSSADIVL